MQIRLNQGGKGMADLDKPHDVNLPVLADKSSSILAQLTKALGVPRDVLASDEEIAYAWRDLPRELAKIPAQLRNELVVRMCVAVAAGLFDSAVNYVWNLAIQELRNRVRVFGLNVVSQIIAGPFDEDALRDSQDSELLSLCLSLNLITEEGFFFLDQCRDVRNYFSAAHPSLGKIDDREFINFVSRCVKFAVVSTNNPKGVDSQAFIKAVRGQTFTDGQRRAWVQKLEDTHEAQREVLFSTLHGIFCDPASPEESRQNALAIASTLAARFTPKTKSELLDRHSEYAAKGDNARHAASQRFFERLGLTGLLGNLERHAIVSRACKKLLSVHNAFNNFYNEPPFAERLLELSQQAPIPETAQEEFVEAVLTGAVGNPYGVSHGAYRYYRKAIENFSPREISSMLTIPDRSTIVAGRISTYPQCKDHFRDAVKLLNPESVPMGYRKRYKSILA